MATASFPEDEVPFSLAFRSGISAHRLPPSPGALERQLSRLETGTAKWTAMVLPVIHQNWPIEMFARYPSQSEVAKRWSETFRGLNFQSLCVSCDVDSPSPWRARRTPDPNQARVFYDLFLPQIGDYLNAGMDANPPEDCARWHADVALFCESVIRQVQSESVKVANATKGAVDVAGGVGT